MEPSVAGAAPQRRCRRRHWWFWRCDGCRGAAVAPPGSGRPPGGAQIAGHKAPDLFRRFL